MPNAEKMLNHVKLYNNGKFVKYNTIKDKKFIYTFIKEDCYSNSSNLEAAVNRLVAYEDTVTRSKNYCVYLQVMYPKDLSKNDQHEFIKKFMFEISLHYKRLLFAYKFVRRGKGHYVDVIAFERELYIREREIEEVYARTMYINKITGRTCSKDDPEAVCRCKKGAVRTDENGCPVKKKILISPKKTRYFNYNSSDDAAVKKANFNNFRLRLCFKASTALSKIFSGYRNIRTLKYAKRSYGFSDVRTVNTQMYNDALSDINSELWKIQQILALRGAVLDKEEAQKRFDSIWYSLDHINSYKTMKANTKNSYKINLSPTASINQNTEKYKETVKLFKDACMAKIQHWYAVEFIYSCRRIEKRTDSKSNSMISDNITWLIRNLTHLKNYQISDNMIQAVENSVSRLKAYKKDKKVFRYNQQNIRNRLAAVINAENKEPVVIGLLSVLKLQNRGV